MSARRPMVPTPDAMLRARACGCVLAFAVISGCSDDSGDAPPEQGDVPDRDDFGVFAKGLHLERVTLDQGVSIAARSEGEDISSASWDTQLIQDRNVLARAMWTLDEDFAPRSLQARFAFHLPSGDTQAAVHELYIDDDANEAWYDLTFRVTAPGAFLVPGVKFDVGIYEIDDGNGSSADEAILVDEVPRYPRAPGASTSLPISEGAHRLEVVVVRIDHQFDGPKECSGLPPIDADELDRMADALTAMNPSNEVVVRLRPEPMVWSESAEDLGKILDALVDVRVADNAEPWVYYFGAIDPCDWGSSEGYAGLGYVPQEPTQELAWKRVSVGDYSGPSKAGPRGTFVHEIGHNSGRKHVPCSGGEANAVTDYPIDGGLTGSWGFDLVNFSLHPPTDADYMSYCDPAWLSAYGWNQVMPVLAILGSWEAQAKAPPSSPRNTNAASSDDVTANDSAQSKLVQARDHADDTTNSPARSVVHRANATAMQLILANYTDGSQRLMQVPLRTFNAESIAPKSSADASAAAVSARNRDTAGEGFVVLLRDGVEVERVAAHVDRAIGLDVADDRLPIHRVAVVPTELLSRHQIDELRFVDAATGVQANARLVGQRFQLTASRP